METSRPALSADGADGDQRKLGVEEVRAGAQDRPEVHECSSNTSWRTWVWLKVKWLMDYRGDWMNETRGSLMMVSTIIATVTFAAAISPPGGVWQVDTIESHAPLVEPPCSSHRVCVAGNAVLAYYYADQFMEFMKYNMISFISSLVVVFLLIGGFPLNNKFCLWLLSLAMCVTISFLGLTFLEALWLVIPGHVLDQYFQYKNVSRYVWLAIICIVGICLLIRLSSWLVRVYSSARFKSAWARLLGFFSSLSLPKNPHAYLEMGGR